MPLSKSNIDVAEEQIKVQSFEILNHLFILEFLHLSLSTDVSLRTCRGLNLWHALRCTRFRSS